MEYNFFFFLPGIILQFWRFAYIAFVRLWPPTSLCIKHTARAKLEYWNIWTDKSREKQSEPNSGQSRDSSSKTLGKTRRDYSLDSPTMVIFCVFLIEYLLRRRSSRDFQKRKKEIQERETILSPRHYILRYTITYNNMTDWHIQYYNIHSRKLIVAWCERNHTIRSRRYTKHPLILFAYYKNIFTQQIVTLPTFHMSYEGWKITTYFGRFSNLELKLFTRAFYTLDLHCRTNYLKKKK